VGGFCFEGWVMDWLVNGWMGLLMMSGTKMEVEIV
jgi:hypothetical protein